MKNRHNFAPSKKTSFYVRGGKIFTYAPTDGSVINAEVKGKFLVDKRCQRGVNTTLGYGEKNWHGGWDHTNGWEGKLKYDEGYKYPLIKVGNHIWTREVYSGSLATGDKHERFGTHIVDGNFFYTGPSAYHTKFPSGWHVASDSDYKNLKEVLTRETGSEGLGGCIKKGGTSGFDAEWNGYYTYKTEEFHCIYPVGESRFYYHDYKQYDKDNHRVTFRTKEGHYVEMTDQEMNIKNEDGKWAMNVRLVMD